MEFDQAPKALDSRSVFCLRLVDERHRISTSLALFHARDDGNSLECESFIFVATTRNELIVSSYETAEVCFVRPRYVFGNALFLNKGLVSFFKRVEDGGRQFEAMYWEGGFSLSGP